MNDREVEQWCLENNWTEPRQLNVGIWVAFPPGGYIETPLPIQRQGSKNRPIEDIVDTILLVMVTVTVFVIALIMSPCFMEPIIDRLRDSLSDS